MKKLTNERHELERDLSKPGFTNDSEREQMFTRLSEIRVAITKLVTPTAESVAFERMFT